MVELRVTLGAFGVEDGPTLLHVETTMTAIGTRSSFRKFFVLVNSNSTLDDDENYVTGPSTSIYYCKHSARRGANAAATWKSPTHHNIPRGRYNGAHPNGTR